MRFRKSNPEPAFRAVCKRCRRWMESDRELIYADLDGKAFVDYYCDGCKQDLEAQEAIVQRPL